MANKITTVIDFVTDGAQRSLKSFRQSISDAEGGFGKFKAGLAAAGSAIDANLGKIALAGATTAVALGTKVVNAFQQTALEAGKLADATGLTVEAASRLREVASDIGVSGETVTTIVKKLNVELGKGNPLLEDLGISLQHTADGAADVNATLLDAIERIQGIEDPTKRAEAAQAAFGRGYADAAELINMNAVELKANLDSVSDSKIVTPEELKRAREFRDTMEDLKDVGEDLATSSGQVLVPALTSVGEILLGIEAAAIKAKDAIEDIPGGKDFLGTAFSGIPDIVDQFQTNARNLAEGLGLIGEEAGGATTPMERFKEIVGETAPAIGDAGEETGEAAEEVADLGDKAANTGPKIGDLSGALKDARDNLADLNDEARQNAMDRLAEAIKGVDDALNDAFGDFEDDLDLLDRLADIDEQFKNLGESGEEGMRRLRRSIADVLRDLPGISPDKKLEILAELRNADAQELRRILDDLTKDRFINIGINGPAQAGFTSGNVDFNPATGTITPTFQGQSATPPSNVTIIYPVGSTPTTQYIDGQTDLRRNGTRNPNIV